MPAQRACKFTTAQLSKAMRRKKREMDWTNDALADYLEMAERQLYRYLNKENNPSSDYMRRLCLERLHILDADGNRIIAPKRHARRRTKRK